MEGQSCILNEACPIYMTRGVLT